MYFINLYANAVVLHTFNSIKIDYTNMYRAVIRNKFGCRFVLLHRSSIRQNGANKQVIERRHKIKAAHTQPALDSIRMGKNGNENKTEIAYNHFT